MYQRRGGGKVRADVGKLDAELVTGVAVGSGNNAGKRLVPPEEPAPPTLSDAEPSDLQMRRPSAATDAYSKAQSEEERKEQTKKQLASITGRMFEVLNNFEVDEETNYDESTRVERRRPSHLSRAHSRKRMQSHIDGMMANYDQISAEREELLESLADWFQKSHSNVGDNTFPDLSYDSGRGQTQFLRQQGSEKMTLPQELDRETLEREIAASFPQPDDDGSGEAATRNAVTMSWKYAAMEIYGLLSDVRNTDAEEMNVLERRIMELVASLTEQSKIIDRLSNELRHQKELVRFSDKTTQRLAADNTDLREKMDKLRGQLLQARNAIKENSTPETDEKLSGVKQEGNGRNEGGGKEGDLKSDSSDSESGRLEVYKGQVKDLKKRLAQLQEENKRLQQSIKLPEKKGKEAEKEEWDEAPPSCSEETTSINHKGDHTPPLPPVPSSPVEKSQSSSSHSLNTETVAKDMNDTRENELIELREELQRLKAEKAALEAVCQKKRKGIEVGSKTGRKETPKKEVTRGQRVQTRSQQTQTTTGTTTTHPSSHPPATKTATTFSKKRNKSANSTAVPVTTTSTTATASDGTSLTLVSTETGSTVPSIAVDNVPVDTVAKEAVVESKKGPLEMLEDVVNDVIVNQSDLITADMATLHRIHGDLEHVCDVILSCLVHSSSVAVGGPESENTRENAATEHFIRSTENTADHQYNKGLQSVPETERRSHHPATRSRNADGMRSIRQRTEVGAGRAKASDRGQEERKWAGENYGREERDHDREREISERRQQPTREEMEMFIGQAMQSIQNRESGLMSAENRDTLKMMFEALKNRREQEELGTIAYPLPAHLITRSNRGHNIVGELHHHSHETTEHQQQDLKHSVSVRGMASGHSINQSSKVSYDHKAQINAILYPWGNAFHSHKHHPSLHPSPGHNPPDLTPSIFTSSPHHSTIVGLGGSTLRMGGGREGEAEKNMREGKKGRKKKHVRYAQVARSNFLQVGNTYGAPPRTAPPAGGLRGVANSLGNHHHANQSTVNVVTNRSEAQPTNDSGATFIDLLNQSPQVSINRSGNTQKGSRVGNGTLKLPHIL